MDNQALCLRYLMGEATEQEVAALNAWLAESPANAERFALLAAQETSMSTAVGNICAPAEPDVMSEIVDQALAMRRQHEIEDEANRQLAAQQQEDARNRRFELRRLAEPEPVKRDVVIPQVLVWLGLAAMIGIAATVAFQLHRSAPQATTPPIVEQPTPPTPSPTPTPTPASPVYVASVGHTYAAVWATRPARGRLEQGIPVTLLQGVVELTFDDGARVVVQAPAVIEPLGTNALRLASGTLTAEVPESAHGFRVHTPQMLVTDLGTAFGVEVAVADEVTEAFVFEGLIEVVREVEAAAATPRRPIALSQGEGVRGEQGRALDIKTINPGRFIREVDTAPYAIEGSDAVCFLETPPRSLMPGAIENNDWLYVMLERTSVLLTESIEASLARPGRYDTFLGTGRGVEIDQAVDSYLVHFDPVGESQPVFLEGTMTFPRPVVAVLGAEGQLEQTDHLFARPGTRLYRELVSPFGLDGTITPGILPDTIDIIELSEDRLTIRFRLHVLTPFDEFRVLIEAAEVSP